MPHRVAVFGITGRMGQSLIRAMHETSGFALSGALASAASPRLGQDAHAEGPPCGVTVTADAERALSGAEVVLEFSVGAAVAAHLELCAASGIPLLVGTTGLEGSADAPLAAAAKRIPVLLAPNTSVGVAVLASLSARTAVALGADFDIEIFEAHHREKRDAPSGTALALGEAIAGARGATLESLAAYARHGEAPRAPGSIGFSVLRAGDIVGEHTVTFAGPGERVELTHRVSDRRVFARGALRGAAWLIGRPPGLYSMKDVLGL